MPRRIPRRCLLLLLPLACALACSASSTRGRSPGSGPASPASSAQSLADGSSAEKAIVVPRDTEREGIAWEYAWIQEHFGNFRRQGQGLVMDPGGKVFDRVTVSLADGTERTLYFDITRYFGHS